MALNCVTWKDGAVWEKPTSAGTHILAALDRSASVCRVDLQVTAGTNDHVMPDPHAQGLAFDVSVKGFDSTMINLIRNYLNTTLGSEFTVLYEVPSKPDDVALANIAYVNAGATAPHFHLQLSKHLTVWPVPVQSPTVTV